MPKVTYENDVIDYHSGPAGFVVPKMLDVTSVDINNLVSLLGKNGFDFPLEEITKNVIIRKSPFWAHDGVPLDTQFGKYPGVITGYNLNKDRTHVILHNTSNCCSHSPPDVMGGDESVEKGVHIFVVADNVDVGGGREIIKLGDLVSCAYQTALNNLHRDRF